MDFILSRTISVSSPGKALIAGGYLVIERPNVGVTVGCSSRFYSSITTLSAQTIDSPSILTVKIESPQFHSTFEYKYDIDNLNIVLDNDLNNIFIEKCISLSFSFLKEFLGASFQQTLQSISSSGRFICIKLRADNDFYSQISKLKDMNLPLTSHSLLALDKFLPCPLDEHNNPVVAKTGMGSSAAMTTSLVASLLEFFQVINLENGSHRDLEILHNLAQLAHAIAQGKIGSGFDVSSAVYGTQVYERFDPSILNACLPSDVSSRTIYETVMNQSAWNQVIHPFSLPPGLDLMMGDVCGGSSSTSMAKAVLQWRSSGKDGVDDHWNRLGQTNSLIAKTFHDLNEIAKTNLDEYDSFLSWAKSVPRNRWEDYSDESSAVRSLFLRLRDLFGLARQGLKSMGEQAGVGIEPEDQSRLADATEGLAGVLAAGVPGAGGEDALFALVLSPETRESVEIMWSTYVSRSGAVVCPLILHAENSQMGVRLEKEIGW